MNFLHGKDLIKQSHSYNFSDSNKISRPFFNLYFRKITNFQYTKRPRLQCCGAGAARSFSFLLEPVIIQKKHFHNQ